MPLILKILSLNDIPVIVEGFVKSGWTLKPAQLFEHYLEEQNHNQRQCWVAYRDDEFAGYVTLNVTGQSNYPPFAQAHIPEIGDLNVLPAFRKCGIGTALLEKCEQQAATKSDVVGIGVGLYPDYGAAQRLYVKRGYIPDGHGIAYDAKTVTAHKAYPVDDRLVLYFTKQLTS